MQIPNINRVLLIRIMAIGLLLALSLGLHLNRRQEGIEQGRRLPYPVWQQFSQSQLLLHDFTMRASLFADLVRSRRHLPLPAPISPEALRDRALAGYETIVLAPDAHVANPYAEYRLGIFYGLDGYAEQAEEALLRAVRADPENEPAYTALLRVFASQTVTGGGEADQLAGVLPELDRLPRWLQDVVTPAYYKRVASRREAGVGRAGGATARARAAGPQRSRRYAPSHRVGAHPYGDAAAAALRDAESRQWRFGLGMLGVLAVLGALFAGGAWVVLRWLYGSIVSEPLSPERRPARATVLVPWGIIDACELLALAFGLLVLLGIGAAHFRARFAWSLAGPDQMAGLIAIQYLLLITICFLVMLRRVHTSAGRELSVLGWRCPRGVRTAVLWGVGGYGVYLVSVVGVTQLPSLLPGLALTPAQVGIHLLGDTTTLSTVIYLVLLGLIAPIAEELLFRGFVYAALRNHLSTLPAILLSSVAFALMHVNTPGNWQILVFGVVLGVLYERTRSVIPCVVCHALNNLLVFAAVLLIHY